MIQEYSKLYGNIDSLGSFDYYYAHYSGDSVRSFIELCLLRSDYSSESEYSGIVDYLTKLFYSVKGTYLVFLYMKKYLKIDFIGKIKYNLNHIEFEISEIITNDLSMYISSLKGFLSTLLFYGDLAANINTINLKLEERVSNTISVGIKKYKEFTVTEKWVNSNK
jgi:hypothetical protein